MVSLLQQQATSPFYGFWGSRENYRCNSPVSGLQIAARFCLKPLSLLLNSVLELNTSSSCPDNSYSLLSAVYIFIWSLLFNFPGCFFVCHFVVGFGFPALCLVLNLLYLSAVSYAMFHSLPFPMTLAREDRQSRVFQVSTHNLFYSFISSFKNSLCNYGCC